MKILCHKNLELYGMWQISCFTGSEDLWVLANLTNPLVLESLGSHEQSFNGFTSNSNSSLAQLHSFARPSLSHLSNFTDILNDAVENDYTSAMWDQDTTLVIYVSNLSSPMIFRITVDQQDLWFLLYFFITFITYVHACIAIIKAWPGHRALTVYTKTPRSPFVCLENVNLYCMYGR